MQLYDTRSRSIREFRPLAPPNVTMYCCGPTVYDVTHIGHMRKYIMDDILKRALRAEGYLVKHVMNITDVGHLSDDADLGEDKLEKGARKHGKSVWDVAAEYTAFFHETMRKVGVEPPDIEPKATDHIEGMVALIRDLEAHGYTYETAQAVYFDTRKFAAYGALSGQKLEDKQVAVRDDVHADPDKRRPQDFALWFKRVGRFANHTMHWDSPWGDGFPGWHIECSAMSMAYLGPEIDIHTGGIDHIPVHHENEIAQSEAATGKQFVQFWVHHNFLMVDGRKMSKSLGNVYTYLDLEARGINPLAVRYLFLQSHYRQEMNFTWEAAAAAQTAFERLRGLETALRASEPLPVTTDAALKTKTTFRAAIADDLNTAKALAVLWEALGNAAIPAGEKRTLLAEFDAVFGFGLAQLPAWERKPLTDLPPDVTKLLKQRADARSRKDWAAADALREELASRGYTVEDAGGTTLVYSKEL
ncbi:MAG: cysteine--tRNA ligase [Patescibacteria group bacterium]|nr:cysteine--tRNA ligase [Patescibacteria group bacterium]